MFGGYFLRHKFRRIIVRIRINFISQVFVHTCKGFRPYCFESKAVKCEWSNTKLNLKAIWNTSFHVSLELKCVVSFYFEGESVGQEIVFLAISISLMHFPLPESDWLFHSRLQDVFRLCLRYSTVKTYCRTPQWKYIENAFVLVETQHACSPKTGETCFDITS